MKRPMLVSGITMIIVSAFLMYFLKTGAIVMLLTGALAFVLYLIKPLKLRKFIIIPAITLSTILICLSFLAYTHFKIEPAIKYDGNISYISGKVISTPVNIDGNLTFVLKTEKTGDKYETVKIDVMIPEGEGESPELYDYISLDPAEISVKRNTYNKYDLSCAADGIILNATGNSAHILWECEKTPYYYCLHFREVVSNRINEYLPKDTAGILNGLVFGGNRNIPQNIADAFRNGGIAHLLAVSGLHTSLWCGLIIFIFNLFKIPKKIRNIFCVIFLIGFCIITGFTPSVLRSSLMSLLLLTSPFAKSEPDSLNSLGFATVLLLLNNPYIIFNPSLQLSLSATVGVIIISRFEITVYQFFGKIKFNLLRRFFSYIVCSLILSAGAALFTMPVSALYFNVLSIASPLTNILCVKPAFYAMICGTVATATSYIEISFVKRITLFLFEITKYLLSLVSEISLKISDFTYCTIPVHKNWLLNGLVCGAVIMCAGYLIYKLKDKRNSLKTSSVIMVLVVFFNIFIPLLPTPYQDEVTIVSSGNNLHIIIRSGLHYAYIINSRKAYPTSVHNYLPKATCESLDYWFVTYATYFSCNDLQRLSKVVTPLETHITPEIQKLCINSNVNLPQNTIIKATGKYTLNNTINLEIIDTYSIKYVIIRGNEKTVYIHLHGTTDFSEVTDTSVGDIFVYNSKIPDRIPETAESIIISGDSDFIINEDYNKLKSQFDNLYLTAREGDIKINI